MIILEYYRIVLLMSRRFSAGLLLTGLIAISCSKATKANSGDQLPADTLQNKPALSGRLVYHSCSCYECNDSRIMLYDFATNSNAVLSTQWRISNPMNAHFSPDGKKIVFMGVDPETDQWDIFISKIGDTAQPVNLTKALTKSRNEDPKFSADGSSIIFKSKGKLTRMDTLGNIIARYTVAQQEASMPYFADHDQYILYAAETNDISSIYSYSIADKNVKTIFTAPGIYAYYPITISDSSFIFTRWYSSSDHHDQLYMGYLNAKAPVALPFNEPSGDYSDAYPVDSKYILLSSTRSGSKGGYDIYIADIHTGAIWSMDLYNAAVNTKDNELGACYHE
jgi:Tol biopolymer transport system component